MKTLDQIEPRVPISALPFEITNSGSYYLTATLSGSAGITISTNQVTLDLAGFALVGAPGNTGSGLYVSGSYTNLAVRNGSIAGWALYGIDAWRSGYPRNLVFENLSVSGNGNIGIYTEAQSTVRGCQALQNGNYGIYIQGGTVSDCLCRENSRDGIVARNSIVRGSRSEANGGNGLYADNSMVTDCFLLNNSSNGIYLASGCRVMNNQITANQAGAGAIGLVFGGTYNYAEGNTLVANGIGLKQGTNMVVHNVILGNYYAGYSVATNVYSLSRPTYDAAGFGRILSNSWENVYVQ